MTAASLPALLAHLREASPSTDWKVSGTVSYEMVNGEPTMRLIKIEDYDQHPTVSIEWTDGPSKWRLLNEFVTPWQDAAEKDGGFEAIIVDTYRSISSKATALAAVRGIANQGGYAPLPVDHYALRDGLSDLWTDLINKQDDPAETNDPREEQLAELVAQLTEDRLGTDEFGLAPALETISVWGFPMLASMVNVSGFEQWPHGPGPEWWAEQQRKLEKEREQRLRAYQTPGGNAWTTYTAMRSAARYGGIDDQMVSQVHYGTSDHRPTGLIIRALDTDSSTAKSPTSGEALEAHFARVYNRVTDLLNPHTGDTNA